MLILAIETSATAGSVALQQDELLLASSSLTPGQRSARSLLPSIAELMHDAGRSLAELGLISVATGPGSFTGLRVGVTAAKTLAYALGAETMGVDTLDAVALQAKSGGRDGATLHAVLDAQRQELFAARFQIGSASSDQFIEGQWRRTSVTSIVPLQDWLDALRPGDLVTGPAVARLLGKLPERVEAAPEDAREPQATSVARLGWQQWQSGRRDNLWNLAPQYYRPSAAEEKAKS